MPQQIQAWLEGGGTAGCRESQSARSPTSISHALRADDILFKINGASRNQANAPVQRPLYRPVPRARPTPMEVGTLQRWRPQEVQCYHCKGYGHIAKYCATRPGPGEQTTSSRVERRPSNKRRHAVMNLEASDPNKRDLAYCGHASDTPRPMMILPASMGTWKEGQHTFWSIQGPQ